MLKFLVRLFCALAILTSFFSLFLLGSQNIRNINIIPQVEAVSDCTIQIVSAPPYKTEVPVSVKFTVTTLGDHRLEVYKKRTGQTDSLVTSFPFSAGGTGWVRILSFTPQTTGDYYFLGRKVGGNLCNPGTLPFTVGKGLPTPALVSGENPCQDFDGDGDIECRTALGDIRATIGGLTRRVLRIGTGLAGGIALIFMVIGSVRVLTSSGDQQKLNAGREMIVAALAGLLFIIFSVLILKFIGVEIIGL